MCACVYGILQMCMYSIFVCMYMLVFCHVTMFSRLNCFSVKEIEAFVLDLVEEILKCSA